MIRDMVVFVGVYMIGGKGFGDVYIFDNAYYVIFVVDFWYKANMIKDEVEMVEYIGLLSDKYM